MTHPTDDLRAMLSAKIGEILGPDYTVSFPEEIDEAPGLTILGITVKRADGSFVDHDEANRLMDGAAPKIEAAMQEMARELFSPVEVPDSLDDATVGIIDPESLVPTYGDEVLAFTQTLGNVIYALDMDHLRVFESVVAHLKQYGVEKEDASHLCSIMASFIDTTAKHMLFIGSALTSYQRENGFTDEQTRVLVKVAGQRSRDGVFNDDPVQVPIAALVNTHLHSLGLDAVAYAVNEDAFNVLWDQVGGVAC